MPAKANKAAKKKPVKKKAAKKPPPDLRPKELTVETTHRVTEVTIKSPLNIYLKLGFDEYGYFTDVIAGVVDSKKASYICTSGLEEMINNVVHYSDEEYADLISVVNAARALHKENQKK